MTGASGVAVAVWSTRPDGSRGDRVASTVTVAGGRFTVEVGAGCYTVVVTAPARRSFAGGATTAEQGVCADPGETVSDNLRFRLR